MSVRPYAHTSSIHKNEKANMRHMSTCRMQVNPASTTIMGQN